MSRQIDTAARIMALIVLFAITATEALADIVLTVGPAGQYSTISAAANVANADPDPDQYYIIKVTPGTYVNDFPRVLRPMTIEADHRGAW